MTFYIDTDVRQGRIYLAPYKQIDPMYLIEAQDRGEAERLMRDLNFKKIKDPLTAPNEYQLIEKVEEQIGNLKGTIFIYKRMLKK
jgi:hypothetical protein